MSPSRSTIAFRAILVAGALAIPLIAIARVHDLPPPIGVRVLGTVRYLPPGETLGQVVARYGLHPTSGDLLDIDGKVLKAGAYPGRLLLNGHAAPLGTVLRDTDVVSVVNGHDRTEGLTTEIIPVPGDRPADPQFFLGTSPGEEVITKGAVSGKIVVAMFRPTGPSNIPRAVALTFDDGPNPTFTPKILGVLTRMHVHATFFVIGYLAERYPDLVRQEVAAGMVVGDHSWNHPNSPPFKALPQKQIYDEMSLGEAALRSIGVESSHIFRPPGGSYDDYVLTTAHQLGLRLVLWSVDPRDWSRHTTAEQILANVIAHARPGSIIEMHDGGGDRTPTLKALPAIIRAIRKMHLQLVTIAAG